MLEAIEEGCFFRSDGSSWVNKGCCHRFGIVAPKKIEGNAVIFEPALVLTRFQDHRHTVVILLQ